MNPFILAIDPVAFELGPLSVYWYGVIIGIGMLVGYMIYLREAERFGFNSDQSFDLFFYTIIFGLIGARLYYVLFTLDYFLQHPSQIIAVWNGGLAIYGGVIAGALTLYGFSKHYHFKLIKLYDIVIPALMFGQIIGRWGNFINQEAHGDAVSRDFLESLHLPEFIINQMNINGTYYHPTFLYESVWNLIGLMIVLMTRRYPRLLRDGDITAFYFLWYGFGRFWIEGLRTDSLYIGAFRVSQLVSLLLIIVGAVILYYNRRSISRVPYYTQGRLTSTKELN